VLAFDTETVKFDELRKAPPLVCCSMAWTGGGRLLFKYDGDGAPLPARDMFSSIFSTLSTGVNLPYDCAVVGAEFPDLIPKIFAAYSEDRITDLSARQKLLDIAAGDLRRPAKGKPHPYSLGEMSKRILGRELKKGDDTWRKRYGELRPVPLAQWPAEAVSYALDDASTPLEIFEAQEHYATYLESQYREARADWWLHLIHCWGFRTDQGRLERFAKKIGDEYDKLEEILIREGLIRNDKKRTRSIAATRERLTIAAAKAGVELKMTSGGVKSAPAVSTDSDTCKALAEFDPVLKSYARISSLKSLLTKDVVAFRGYPQIHPNFDGLNLNGRTSSYDPQVQNLPRMVGMREVIIPRPGHLIIDNDYPQIELRTWAQICIWVLGHSRMAELLNAGLDPHLDLGSRILGVTYERAKEMLKAEKAAKERGEKGLPTPASDARQISKPGNFGYMGGMGWETFIGFAREQYDIILSNEASKNLHTNWLATWPEAKPYFAWIKNAHAWMPKLNPDGSVFLTKEGRRPLKVATIKHFVSGMVRGGAVYTDACNNYFSALAQVIGKEAMFRISRECYDVTQHSILLGCRPINWVHDQVLAECPDDALAHDRAMRMSAIMDGVAEEILPDLKTKSEPCLARRWSKDAISLYDAAGRLIPWEEKEAA